MLKQCPTPERLAVVVYGSQSPEDDAEIAVHLADCPTCQARLEELAGDSAWLEANARLRGATNLAGQRQAVPKEPKPSPHLEQAMEKLQRRAEPSGNSIADPLLASAIKLHPFGDYEILEELGRGGMGVVYRARQVSLNRPVALKLILAGQLASETEVRRFHNEAEAAARLDHSNIVPIYEIGEHEGRHYFSMKLIEGEPLSSCLAAFRSEKSRRDIARLVAQVAHAIHYAHQHGILHRDLKPSNILVDTDHQPHLTDFGLAKILESESNLTRSMVVMGTPNYMAPEVAAGKAREVSTAVDVFSLGAILYELLTGRPPFQAETAAATLHQVIHADPPLPRSIDPDVPRDLATICMKCLEKEPARRYSSAAMAAEELERFLESKPILARPVSVPERVWRWAVRYPVVAVLVTVVHVVFALGLAGIVWQWRRAAQSAMAESRQRRVAEQASRRAVQAVTRLEIDRVESLFKANDSAQALALLARLQRREPTNRVVAERLMSALAERQYCLPVAPLPHGPPLHTLTPDERRKLRNPFPFRYGGSVVCANVSPDGNAIVTASEDGTARVWDVRTGRPLTPPLRHQAEVLWASFSPDGDKVVTASFDHTARVWDAATGEPLTPPLTHAQAVWHAEFSPDGTQVVTACEDMTARLWDARSGSPIGLPLQHAGAVYHASFSKDGNQILTASSPASAMLWETSTHRRIFSADHFYFRDSSLPGPAMDETAEHLVTLRWYAASVRRPSIDPGALAHLDHEDCVMAAAFSPDGSSVATASLDSTARIWNVENGKPVCPPLRHHGWVFSALFSADGRFLVTGSHDETARLWSAQTGQPVVEPLAHPTPVLMARTAAKGQRIVTVTESDTAWLWSVPPARRGSLLVEYPGKVRLVRFSSDGELIAIVTGETASVFNSRTGEKILGPLQHAATQILWDAEFSPDSTCLATASELGDARIWRLDGTSPSCIRLGHDDEVRRVRFNPDGTQLVTASDDGTARVWDVASGKLLFILKHSRQVSYAEFNQDGTAIATASSDGSACIWDARTGKLRTPPLLHNGVVYWVGFSPDGQRVATTGSDRTVRLWDARTGKPLWEPLVFNDDVVGQQVVQFSPRNNRLVTAAANLAQVWDTATGRAVIAPLRHPGLISTVRFSPDGTRFVTACSDGSIRQWDTETGQTVSETIRYEAKAADAVYSPNGRRLLSCSSDKTVRIQEVPRAVFPVPDWLPELAEALAGQRINEEDVTEDVRVEELLDLKQRLLYAPDSDYYTRWIRPILAHDGGNTSVVATPNPILRRNRARQLATQQSWDQAAKEWGRVIDFFSDGRQWDAPRKLAGVEVSVWPEVFRRVTELRPQDTSLWIGRGQYYVLRRQWMASATNYANAYRSRDVRDENIFEYAGALLLTGNVEGYRQLCTNLAAATAGSTDSFLSYLKVRTFGISQVETVPPQQLVDWAVERVKDDPQPWVLHVLGLAYYRAGDFERAISTIQKSEALQWDAPAPALNWLVLAMAHHRLGNKNEAEQYLRKAQQIIERTRAKRADDPTNFRVPDMVEVELLRREAEALLQ